jgi:hypothetical protein
MGLGTIRWFTKVGTYSCKAAIILEAVDHYRLALSLAREIEAPVSIKEVILQHPARIC